jgi:hypothetical protein
VRPLLVEELMGRLGCGCYAAAVAGRSPPDWLVRARSGAGRGAGLEPAETGGLGDAASAAAGAVQDRPDQIQAAVLARQAADHLGPAAGLAEDLLDEVGNWYERPWMPPAPTDRLLVVAGELRSTVRPSGTGASGSKRRLGRPVIVRWAASPS